MFRLLPLAILAILTLTNIIPPVLAQYCDSDYLPNSPLCDNAIQGVFCCGYNATFDDLTPNTAINYYEGVTFDSFSVGVRGAANPIIPASKHYYARSKHGHGKLTFPVLGQLFGFSYACARAASPKNESVAAPCNLTVTASCVDFDNPYNEWKWKASFEYVPNTDRYAEMAYVDWQNVSVPAGGDGNLCFGYAFKAVLADGGMPYLYLDDVANAAYTLNG